IDPAQQVPLRDHVIEPKFVEKVRLLSILSSHHRRIILPSFNQQESSFSPSRKPFFDSIGRKQRFKLRHYRKAPAKAIAAALSVRRAEMQCERPANSYPRWHRDELGAER